MSDTIPLRDRRCQSCAEGGDPLPPGHIEAALADLHRWKLAADGKSVAATYKFDTFHETMSFVNAVAHVANVEDHHPDLAVSYGRCTVTFWTHTVGGVSENDLICAAKVEALL